MAVGPTGMLTFPQATTEAAYMTLFVIKPKSQKINLS
jgi:hypothetical protein